VAGLPAVAGAVIVLTTSGHALVTPFLALKERDCEGVVGDRRDGAARTDTGPVECGRVTGVGGSGGGVGDGLKADQGALGRLGLTPCGCSIVSM